MLKSSIDILFACDKILWEYKISFCKSYMLGLLLCSHFAVYNTCQMIKKEFSVENPNIHISYLLFISHLLLSYPYATRNISS